MFHWGLVANHFTANAHLKDFPNRSHAAQVGHCTVKSDNTASVYQSLLWSFNKDAYVCTSFAYLDLGASFLFSLDSVRCKMQKCWSSGVSTHVGVLFHLSYELLIHNPIKLRAAFQSVIQTLINPFLSDSTTPFGFLFHSCLIPFTYEGVVLWRDIY